MKPEAKVAALGTAEILPIGSITPSPTNPRKISDKAVEIVAKSITEFGWQQPIIVDREMVIIAGHTRYRAAQLLGLTQVPVIVAKNLTPAQAKAFRIVDNRTHDFTSWDFPALAGQLEELADEYSDVLALQDWQALVQDFDTGLDLDAATTVHFDTQAGFRLTIVFSTKEKALASESEILKMPGVVDVRHAR